MTIEIGTTPSASRFRRLTKVDAGARLEQIDGGCEARQTCADDMDRDGRAHRTLFPSKASARRNLLRLMGVRGASNPRVIMASSKDS